MREIADLRSFEALFVFAEKEHAGDGKEDEDDVEREQPDAESREGAELHHSFQR
jgi:hypothetical protein